MFQKPKITPILPTVYGESLSYLETLCKVIKAVNALSEAFDDNLTNEINAWIQANYNELFFNAVYNSNSDTLVMSLADAIAAKEGSEPVSYIELAGKVLEIVDKAARDDIATIAKSVDENTEDLTKLNGLSNANVSLKRVVIFGDSYLEGYLLDSPTTENWGAKFRDFAGIENCQIFGKGGVGFGKSGDLQEFNATTYFNSIKSQIENPEEVTAFIVGLGWNDRSNQAVLQANCDLFWTTVRAYLPNAKLIYFVNPSFTVLRKQVLDILYDRAESNDVVVINSFYWMLFDVNLFNADRVHPNRNGAERIAHNLLSCLCGGSIYHYMAIPFEEVADGWTANITVINETAYLFASGTKMNNGDTLNVGKWPTKIFDGNANSTKPQISGSQMVQLNNSDLNFGYFLWSAQEEYLTCKSMYKTGTGSAQYSGGVAVLNIALPVVMLFG